MKNQTPKAKRLINGIFLLDKPKDMSSNQAVQRVKHAFSAKKAGHTGTLDPMATGLLPICLGEATKFASYTLDANKSYEATILLGQQTDTGDAEGQVISETNIPELSKTDLEKVLNEFLGSQTQIPPMYSALKQQGKKLYELARQGVEVERPARNIHLSELTLLGFDGKRIDISVTCSKGTYIRILGEDIAKKLGTVGHLTSLRRTKTACFTIENTTTLDALLDLAETAEKDTLLLPCNAGIGHIPSITLDEEQCKRVKMGQRLNVYQLLTPELHDVFKRNDDGYKIDVSLFLHTEFLGLAQLEASGRLQPKKIIQN